MQLSRHLDKGLWALADKALPAIYGVAFMLLVIRTLPNEQYGVLILLQTTYLIISQLSLNLGMAPFVKFYYETDDKLSLQTNALVLMLGMGLLSLALLTLFREILGRLLNSQEFSRLAYFVVLLYAASLGKLVTNEIFRARHRIRDIFWTDAIYFLSNISLLGGLLLLGRLHSATSVLAPMSISFFASSVLGIWLARRDISPGIRFDRGMMRSMLRFGKYTYGSSVTSNIYMYADAYIVSAILSPLSVALLGAVKIFLRVFDLYRQTMSLIAFPAFARLHSERRQQDLRKLYEKGIYFSNLVLFGLALGLILFADFFFEVILNGKYPGGAEVLRSFSTIALFLGWQSLGEGILFGVGLAKYPFWARVVATIVSVALNIILVHLIGIWGAVIAGVASSAVIAAMVTYFVYTRIGFSFRSLFGRGGDLLEFVRRFNLKTIRRDR